MDSGGRSARCELRPRDRRELAIPATRSRSAGQWRVTGCIRIRPATGVSNVDSLAAVRVRCSVMEVARSPQLRPRSANPGWFWAPP